MHKFGSLIRFTAAACLAALSFAAAAPAANADVIVPPRGFDHQYTQQFNQVSQVCTFNNTHPTPWTDEVRDGYYSLVSTFETTRTRLNRQMARRHLGFAPDQSDWLTIRNYRPNRSKMMRVTCPDPR